MDVFIGVDIKYPFQKAILKRSKYQFDTDVSWNVFIHLV